MADEVHGPASASGAAERGRRDRLLRSTWRAVRRPLAQSRFVKGMIASMLAWALRAIRWTNRADFDVGALYDKYTPAIAALWHGQHLLIPFYYPRGRSLVIMVSRSADAEMNALVIEKIGMEAVRGSGGRESTRHLEKGGAKALIALKRALDSGKNVAMIADIPHGTPREAGLGIVTLARLSGRPIVPIALATSRRKVLEKSWDKTTISLPFGRAKLGVGEPIYVPADADEAVMEEKRRELTASLNAATEQAYRAVDSPR